VIQRADATGALEWGRDYAKVWGRDHAKVEWRIPRLMHMNES